MSATKNSPDFDRMMEHNRIDNYDLLYIEQEYIEQRARYIEEEETINPAKATIKEGQ